MDIITASFLDSLRQKLFGGFMEDIGLLMLAFKVVILLFIVGFVRSHFGDSQLATILMLAIGYIVLFQQWYIFGPMMLIYMFIIFGFGAILMDLAITKPWTKHAWTGKMPEMEGGGGYGGMGGGEAEELEDRTGARLQHELHEQQRRQAKATYRGMGRF